MSGGDSLEVVQAGSDGWATSSATFAEIRDMIGPPLPPEPATTADLAKAGTLLGTADDTLRVAARLLCRTERKILGAVLHLNRDARDLPPVWLAEVLQGEIGRWVSQHTVRGLTTSGARLADVHAVPVPSGQVSMGGSVLISCVRVSHDHHRIAGDELIAEGWQGLRRRNADDTPQHAVPLG